MENLSEMGSDIASVLGDEIEGHINSLLDEVEGAPAVVRGFVAAAISRLRSAQEAVQSAGRMIEGAADAAD